MAENYDLQRLEDQLYQYCPELKRDSEDVKSERRNRLGFQLRQSYPLVQLPVFDAISSLVNIKDLLDKCKDSVVDPMENCLELALASPSTSIFESSGDEFLISHKPRRVPRKRKSRSFFFNSEFVESRTERKEQDSPLSVSILIPQVVQSSDKMEISIDLGGIDASQRLFASRVDGLLRNRSISSSINLDDFAEKEGSSTFNKLESPQMTTSTSSSVDNNDKQEDELLSRLISQVLVESNDTETLQATNVLDNINNNEISNYDAVVSKTIETLKEAKKKKAPRKPKKVPIEKGPPKKRGRKPKSKSKYQDVTLENIGLPKSDLAKYVELFSNTCNMAGSATPAASSTMSQQLVTSTTHYIDSNEQHPITYYVQGDWENGGSCQLIQTESVPIDGAQEEFNMAELVNYIDNVGDAGNVIARVLDGSNTVPILVQDSSPQINSVVPPPAHVCDVLLDLSKKSTTTLTSIASEISHNSDEVENNEVLPLDLSLKSSKFNETPIAFNADLTTSIRLEAPSEEVFVNNDYGSFEAALDMPLIDIEDNINAFMELTKSQETIPENARAIGTSLKTVCGATISDNSNIQLPACELELGGIFVGNNVCNTDCDINTQSGSVFNNAKNGCSVSSTKVYTHAPELFKSIMKTAVNTDESSTDVRICDVIDKVKAPERESVATTNHIAKISTTIHTLTKENGHFDEVGAMGKIDVNNFEIETSKLVERDEITGFKEKCGISPEIDDATDKRDTHSEAINTCETDIQSTSDAAFTHTILAIEYCKKTDQNKSTTQDDIKNKSPLKLMSIEDNVDSNNELHGNLSDKSSIDFLFVDTDSLPGNRLKYSYGEAITDSSNQFLTKIENDENSYDDGIQAGTLDNDDVVCDLSTNNDQSKSIDLEEDCQGHNVSVHLPMPKLTLMGNNSEEFNYDYDVGFESGEEKDLLTAAAVVGDGNNLKRYEEADHKPLGYNATHHGHGGTPDNNSKETISFEKENMAEDEGKENSTFEDSAVFCSQKYLDSSREMERGMQDLQQNNHLDNNEIVCTTEDNKFNIHLQTEKCIPELSQPDGKVKIKKENFLTSLSVLEMESKLDDVCLDFEDELEDDALSLATSYFNSSDDERLLEHNTNSVQTSSDNIGTEKDDIKIQIANNALNTESNKTSCSSNFGKLPTMRESSAVSGDIFRKFKIPKISMTSATVKHSNPTGSVAAAAPLPMVILPPNAFQKQLIKTEPDSNKPAVFEKLTRTVQNVCAVTPLTLQHSTYASPIATSNTTSSSLEVVAPLIRDILQLTPPIIGEDTKDFKTLNTGCSIATSLNSQQIMCTRGESAGNGGDGRNFGPPTIVLAKTFGVTCLPFLVGRCFTPSCQFSHLFRDPDFVKSILSTLSEVDVNLAYKFAYNHEILFRQYMPNFCKIYVERNNRFKLLNMVRDCERYKGGGELLLIIFHSLTQCGLNKVNACRQILSYCRDRSGTTIDALVDIILEADWTMFCDYIEKFSDVSTYHFRLNILHQMAPTILHANDQRMTSVFFKCLVNLDPKDVGLVHSSPILMQLLELIKNGQTCR